MTSTRTISYGKSIIHYDLHRMDRKSLAISVHPDKRVVVKAPASGAVELIDEKVRKRAKWISRQIALFSQFDPRTPARRYVGGESHAYLGRKYRLKISESSRDRVLLKHGFFRIESTSREPKHIKGLMDTWYQGRAETHLTGIFEDCWQRFSKGGAAVDVLADQPQLKLQKMSSRWGSLSAKGRLTLNPDLIQAPRECIEYVVVHELCHLVHHHHGPAFYKLLDRTLPNWQKLKHKLEMSLA